MIRSVSAAVLIENKVNSPESGSGQYADYLEVLSKWAGSRESRAYLLAPDTRDKPSGWTASLQHCQIAGVFRRLAEETPGLPFWDRVLYGILTGDLDPDPLQNRVQQVEALLAGDPTLSPVALATGLSRLIHRPNVDPRGGEFS